ncbi:MAG: type IV secretion system DNA-binding domain-containing protein [Candidatus Pacebacteria bacterium]|nr:type IV secretion system DNA-binding domain-containing protein [Candidatus Paceibacterota bacterium]
MEIFLNPQILVLILAGIAFLVLLLIFNSLLGRKRERFFLNQGMNLSLFLITLPYEGKIDKEKEMPLQDYLKLGEQFFSSLAGIREENAFSRFLFGNPYFVFEIAVHHAKEEIFFYVACPRKFSQIMEKQILGFWPRAQVQSIEDYNIFNPEGASVGSKASLSNLAILPIKSYKDFQVDPLSSITSTLTKLKKEGEGAAVQILFRSSKKSIKKQAFEAVQSLQSGKNFDTAMAEAKKSGFFADMSKTFAPKNDKKPEDAFNRTEIGPAQQEAIASISTKASQSLFDVNLRILVSAENEIRAKSMLGEIESSFEQFNAPLLNQFKFKHAAKRELKKLFYKFSFRLFNESEAMVFSSGELATIFHLPASSLHTPNIKWIKMKQVAPPVNLPEQGINIGKSAFRAEERIVRGTDEDRQRHFYIVGQTGTGKSVLIQEMLRQDIEGGQGVALIDPHGDLAERVLGLIPASRAEDVIYFNPGDVAKPLGLNILEYDRNYPESKTFVVNEILEIFEKLYNMKAQGFGGPIFEQYMRNALLLVMEDPDSGTTLIEVPRVLADTNFRKYKLSRCKNIVVKNFWEQEAEKAGGEAALVNMVPYITSKMNVFTANDLVRPIISQQQSSINFREIMDQGKILIVNLSKGKLGDINSYLLGMIIVGKILIAAMSRADLKEEKRKPFYLYIDEFHNVTTGSIASALAEARKYKLAMVLAHQFIGQIDEDTRKAIFGNVGSIICFRVGPEDAKYLVTQFEPVFDENDLVNIDNRNAAIRLLIGGETSNPFNIVTFPPSQSNEKVAELIKELSRVKYGRDLSVVEDELSKRMQEGFF